MGNQPTNHHPAQSLWSSWVNSGWPSDRWIHLWAGVLPPRPEPTGHDTDCDPQLMGVVVLISTAVTGMVYNLHSMTLTDNGVTIKNWGSLFFRSETRCDWNEIEDLDVQRGGP